MPQGEMSFAWFGPRAGGTKFLRLHHLTDMGNEWRYEFPVNGLAFCSHLAPFGGSFFAIK